VKVKNRKHSAMSPTTTLDKLLAEKQALLERLQEENIGPAERDEIESTRLGRAPVNRNKLLPSNSRYERLVSKRHDRRHPAMSRVGDALA
jgi:hypothetical protein